jgi:hypothetical protein
MGRSWKDDDWHDEEELQEAEYRKNKRKKRQFVEPDIELGEPKKKWEDTFSAEDVIMDTYFKRRR